MPGSELRREVAPSVLNTLRVGPRVRLVQAVDAEGVDYGHASRPIDIKTLELHTGQAITLQVEVLGSLCDIEVITELDPSSTAAHDFYADLQPAPELPVISHTWAGYLGPGLHAIAWAGRDNTVDRRILLAGRYRIRIRASVGVLVHEVETHVEIAPPHAINIGQDYRKHGEDHSTRGVVEHAASQQRALKDGTRYEPSTSVAITAREGMEAMRRSAIAFHTNHSNPGELAFYHAVSEREPAHSSLTMASIPEGEAGADYVSFRDLGVDATRDCLMVITAGCQTGNETFLIQHLLTAILYPHLDPTPQRTGRQPVGYCDGIVGPKTRRAIRMFEKIKRMPIVGEVTPVLIAALGITPSHNATTDAKAVQGKLRDLAAPLNAGMPSDGASTSQQENLMARTRAGIAAYQSIAGLSPTGISDRDTVTHMMLAAYRVRGVTLTPEQQADRWIAATRGPDDAGSRNVVESFANRGAEIAVGFKHKVFFTSQQQWSQMFWQELAAGMTVTDAAKNAVKPLTPDEKQRHELQLINRDSSPQTIIPARHGSNR